MIHYHYKQVPYWKTDRITKVTKNKIVMSEESWKMVRDYITILEGNIHILNGQTFGSIREEMVKVFGEEKVSQLYEKKVKKPIDKNPKV